MSRKPLIRIADIRAIVNKAACDRRDVWYAREIRNARSILAEETI